MKVVAFWNSPSRNEDPTSENADEIRISILLHYYTPLISII